MSNRRRTKDDLTNRERLEHFLDDVGALKGTALMQKKFNPTFSINIQRHDDDVFVSAGPKAESPRPELVELTAAHRKFTDDEEASHLYRILSICDQYVTDDAIRHQLRDLRTRYQDAFKGNLNLRVNDRQMDGGEALNRLKNGDFLHSGLDRKRELARMSTLERSLDRHFSERALIATSGVIVEVEAVIKMALERGVVSEK